jgi:hypothetical protein
MRKLIIKLKYWINRKLGRGMTYEMIKDDTNIPSGVVVIPHVRKVGD